MSSHKVAEGVFCWQKVAGYGSMDLMAESDLLTPEESAKYLRMNVDSVRRLLRTGKLPGVKVGGVWRIRMTALDEMLVVGKKASPKK